MHDSNHFDFPSNFEIYINGFDEIYFSNKVSDDNYLDYISFYVDEKNPNYKSLIRSLKNKLIDRPKFEFASDFVDYLEKSENQIYRKFALGYKEVGSSLNEIGLLKNWDSTKHGCLSINYNPDNPEWLNTIDAIIEQVDRSTFYNKVLIATNEPSQYSKKTLLKDCVEVIDEDPRVAIDNFIAKANSRINSTSFETNLSNEILIFDIDFDLDLELSRPEDLMYLGYSSDQAENVCINLNKIIEFGPSIGFAIVNVLMLDEFKRANESWDDSSIMMRNMDAFKVFEKLSYSNRLRIKYSGTHHVKSDDGEYLRILR